MRHNEDFGNNRVLTGLGYASPGTEHVIEAAMAMTVGDTHLNAPAEVLRSYGDFPQSQFSQSPEFQIAFNGCVRAANNFRS